MVLAAIREQEIGGETFIALDDSNLLVRSKSEPGEWHSIQMWNGRAISCTCKGFAYRNHCRHLEAVGARERLACESCGKLTDGRFAGRVVCAMCLCNQD